MNILNRNESSTQTQNKISQFVQDVIEFSSQYGKEHSKSYTVANIRSMPTHYPRYGDFLECCVFRTYGPWWMKPMHPAYIKTPTQFETKFISEDFIEVLYGKKVVLESVIIYETYHPGACVAIYAYDTFSLEWILVWSIFNDNEFKSNKMARNRAYPPKCARKFMPDLTRKDVYTEIEFEHSNSDYYTELDAIEIIGYPYEDINQIGKHLRYLADKFDQMKVNQPNDHDTQTDLNKNKNDLVEVTDESMLLFKNTGRRRSSFVISQTTQSTKMTSCSHLTELPNEIFGIIFSYLDLKTIFRLRSTCKFFYELCSDECLFKMLNLKPYWYLLDDQFLSLMKDLSHDIRVLDLSWTKFKSNEILNEFFKISCQNLTVLKLDSCNYINGKMVSFISTNCENIKELSLSSCNFKDVDGLCDIKNLTNLVNLNLYRTLIQIEQLEQILISCTKLRHLNLGSCIEIKDFDSIMYLISKYLPNIESLDLWRAYGLSHDSLNKISNSCFNLQYLDIGWCRGILNYDCIRILIKNNKNLKKLFLTSLRVSDVELICLSKNCQQLEQLDILGSNLVTLDAIEMILKDCKNLKFFDISFCANVDLSGFVRLSQIFPNCSIKKSTQSD